MFRRPRTSPWTEYRTRGDRNLQEGESLSLMWSNRTAPGFTIHGLPRIENLDDLASHSGFSTQQLWCMAQEESDCYRVFKIPKKRGGYRHISQPTPLLMKLQRWVLRKILDKLHPTAHSFGFVPGSKLRHHAEQHVGAIAILSLDLKDFFDSISLARATHVFRTAGYCSRVASMLARLCTLDDKLPQGAPSSPQLANLSCFRMDRRLAGLAERRGFTYTRYADDISFSGQSASSLAKARPFIAHIVRESGFSLNTDKTHLAGPGSAVRVTGLVVTSDRVGIGRKRLRDLRVRIHRLHAEGDRDKRLELQGWLDFVSDADPVRYRMLVEYIHGLRVHSPESPLAQLRTRRQLP